MKFGKSDWISTKPLGEHERERALKFIIWAVQYSLYLFLSSGGTCEFMRKGSFGWIYLFIFDTPSCLDIPMPLDTSIVYIRSIYIILLELKAH